MNGCIVFKVYTISLCCSLYSVDIEKYKSTTLYCIGICVWIKFTWGEGGKAFPKKLKVLGI